MAVSNSGSDVRRRIEEDVQLLHKLAEVKVRVWRYVESQKALFGFVSSDEQDARSFHHFIAFPDLSKIPEQSAEEPPACVRGSDSFWDIRPEKSLPDDTDATTLWFLTAEKPQSESGIELLGVVCLELSEERYLGFDYEKQTRLRQFLVAIRDSLRTFSLLQFYDAFKTAREFIRKGEPTLEPINEQSIAKQLATLVENLRVHGAVSIYIRRLPIGVSGGAEDSTESIPLVAGVGEFYDALRQAETGQGSAYYRSTFSQHAYEILSEQTSDGANRDQASTEGVLYPGGGNAKDFDDHHDWLLKARDALRTGVKKNDPTLAERIAAEATEMIEEGSFGVFPIRWVTATEKRGPLIGLLCVAARDVRHFFTWTRCLLLDQFCQRLGRQHSDLAPFLDNVGKETHQELLSSLNVLRRVTPASILLQPPTKAERQCFAFVLSVDIRRSTDLMARMVPGYADRYGHLLIGLWNNMKKAVLEEHGIFDKFTGDGILAYFPDFFEANRRTAAIRLLRAVEKCHDAFRQSYPLLWKALNAVPAMGSAEERSVTRAGLGVGLDFGSVRLVNVGAELTIVGAPVVYACRLASAAWAFTTLANFPCYYAFKESQILDMVDCKPVSIPIKHDEIHAYRVTRRSWLSAPEWKLKRNDEPRWDAEWHQNDDGGAA